MVSGKAGERAGMGHRHFSVVLLLSGELVMDKWGLLLATGTRLGKTKSETVKPAVGYETP